MKTTNKLKMVAIVLFLVISTAQTALAINVEPIGIIKEDADINKDKAKLGKALFFDTRLTKSGDISCNTCHLLDKHGIDHVPASLNAKFSKRNSPTVYNSRFNFKQLWDGRAEDLSHQLDKLSFVDWDNFLVEVKKDGKIAPQFKDVFGEEATVAFIKDAIVEYEKTLITPNSPFDKYLQGDKNAINSKAKAGYALFKSYGCVACHQGVNVGGNIFQKFGVIKDINLRSQPTDDLGRFNVTKNEWDKFVFKVPSLRLAVHTAPYFHDGSVETIEEAVNIMIEFQLQRTVPEEERDKIVEFLKTLPGELQY